MANASFPKPEHQTLVVSVPQLMRTLTNDHEGVGAIRAYRAYDGGTSDFTLAFIDLVVIPPGSSIGLHRHGNDEETYVVLRGNGAMSVDGAEFRVCAGDLVRNHRHGEHGLRNDSSEELHLLVFEELPDDGTRE